MTLAFLLPPFVPAYAISLAGALLFVLWIFFDCSFSQTVSVVHQDLRMRFFHDAGLRYEHRRNMLGPRLLAFAGLTTLSLAATLTVVLRLFLGTHGERSLGAMLLVTGLIAIWTAVFVSYRHLLWRGLWFRIYRFQHALEEVAAMLLDHWPQQDVVLPGLGTYVVSPTDPYTLFRRDGCAGWKFHEIIGQRIVRTADADFRFHFESNPLCCIEFRREGRTPPNRSVIDGPFFSGIVTRELQYSAEYAPGWYFTCYSIAIESKDEPAAEIVTKIAQRPTGMRLPHKGGRFRASSDLTVNVVVWLYAPFLPYPSDEFSIVPKPRKSRTATIPIASYDGHLRKGEVLCLNYEPDTTRSTHCHLVPENHDDLEQSFVDAKSRNDRDYSNYSICLPYDTLDKEFEWLKAGD